MSSDDTLGNAIEAVVALTGDDLVDAVANTKRMKNLLRSGLVERWHTHGRNLQQNVGEHSWGVALLVLALRPDASAELLRAAILHDVHEIDFGDVPNPTKVRHPIISAIEDESEHAFWRANLLAPLRLTDEERRLLKACDRLEALFFISRNMTEDLREISRRILQAIVAVTEEHDDD